MVLEQVKLNVLVLNSTATYIKSSTLQAFQSNMPACEGRVGGILCFYMIQYSL